jgi:hypothetical protein
MTNDEIDTLIDHLITQLIKVHGYDARAQLIGLVFTTIDEADAGRAAGAAILRLLDWLDVLQRIPAAQAAVSSILEQQVAR